MGQDANAVLLHGVVVEQFECDWDLHGINEPEGPPDDHPLSGVPDEYDIDLDPDDRSEPSDPDDRLTIVTAWVTPSNVSEPRYAIAPFGWYHYTDWHTVDTIGEGDLEPPPGRILADVRSLAEELGLEGEDAVPKWRLCSYML